MTGIAMTAASKTRRVKCSRQGEHFAWEFLDDKLIGITDQEWLVQKHGEH
jgi:hypothetical protein